MADLVDKFFKEDLSEAEKKALDLELGTSEEAATRFGETAERAYKGFGLPDPRWTGPEFLTHADPSAYKPWFWVLSLLAVFMGAFYFIRVEMKNSGDEASLNSASLPQVMSLKSPSSSRNLKNESQDETSSSHHPIILVQASVSSTARVGTVPALPPLAPEFTPVNVDQNPNQPFSSLSVQLHLSTSRVLKVRILDSLGNELVPLFSGSLAAGTWAFEWNGLLKNGLLAPPGTYKIEVSAGSWVQTKEVVIQK